MMKLIIGFICIMAANFTIASELTDAPKSQVKVLAINQLVEWMEDGPFYKITKIESDESTNDSDLRVISVKINFDDSLGCKERSLSADCLDLGDAFACNFLLTDCIPKDDTIFKKSHTYFK